MHVMPLPMALAGVDLTLAAEVRACLIHGHSNSSGGAIAGSWMLRWTLERGHFSADLVERAIAELCSAWARGRTVADSLIATLAFAERDDEWLGEAAIPEGGGD